MPLLDDATMQTAGAVMGPDDGNDEYLILRTINRTVDDESYQVRIVALIFGSIFLYNLYFNRFDFVGYPAKSNGK